MPSFKVKAIKDQDTPAKPSSEERRPRVHIPISKAWAEKLEVGGDSTTITLKGKILGLSLNEPEEAWRRNELEFEIHEVELPYDNEYDELADA